MTRMRQRIAQRLKEAQNVNAMLTTFNEVDMRSVSIELYSTNMLRKKNYFTKINY